MNEIQKAVITRSAELVLERMKPIPQIGKDNPTANDYMKVIRANDKVPAPLLSAFHMFCQVQDPRSETIRQKLHDHLDAVLDLMNAHAKEIAKSVK